MFRPSQGLASRNIPTRLAWQMCFVGEGRFLWFVSLTRAVRSPLRGRLRRSGALRAPRGPTKEMNRPRSGRTLLIHQNTRTHPTADALKAWIPAFAGMTIKSGRVTSPSTAADHRDFRRSHKRRFQAARESRRSAPPLARSAGGGWEGGRAAAELNSAQKAPHPDPPLRRRRKGGRKARERQTTAPLQVSRASLIEREGARQHPETREAALIDVGTLRGTL